MYLWFEGSGPGGMGWNAMGWNFDIMAMGIDTLCVCMGKVTERLQIGNWAGIVGQGENIISNELASYGLNKNFCKFWI